MKKISSSFSIKSTFLEQLDFALLSILIILILMFQFGKMPIFAPLYDFRIAIYAWLYCRLLFSYRLYFTRETSWLSLFIFFAVLVAINTLIFFNETLAVHGLMRFLNVALLAPLFVVILKTKKQLNFIIFLVYFDVIVGSLFAIYQLFGGDVISLFGPYVAHRAGFYRYMTNLGEPNAGAAAAIILMVISIYIENYFLKFLGLFFAIVFLVLSMSKTAFIGFGLVFALSFFFLLAEGVMKIVKKTPPQEVEKTVKKEGSIFSQKVLFNVAFYSNACKKTILLVISLVVALWLFNVIAYANKAVFFGRVFANTDVMLGRHQETLKQMEAKGVTKKTAETLQRAQALGSLRNDIQARTVGWLLEESSFLVSHYPLKTYGFVLGFSYGLVGSSAIQFSADHQAITPHDGYLEIYFVGGILMVLTLLMLLYTTLKRMFATFLVFSISPRIVPCFIIFLFLCLFMIAYPVTSVPVIGTVFWLIVGIFCNKYRGRFF